MNKPKIITLCGSSRYPEQHLKVQMDLTLKGNIVIPMGCYGHADFPKGARAATSDGDETKDIKQMLDTLHKRKIDISDGIVVVTVGKYYGNSTKGEIEYAKQNNKTVEFIDFDYEQRTTNG